MTLAWLHLSTATLFMDGALESIMEIAAVVVYFLISYALERRKKKNQPEPTPEEVLKEAGIEFPAPVEIDVEGPQDGLMDLDLVVLEEQAQPVPTTPVKDAVDHWRMAKEGFRAVNARALTIAQDYGRLPSMRTFVRDLEAGIRTTTRKYREELEERREQWGDERVAEDAKGVQADLMTLCDHAERLGQVREASDMEWRRWDELAAELYAPLRRVFNQLGDEGSWKDIMVVPEDFPSHEFQQVVPAWGWVRVPGIGPGWSLALARAISRDLILRNRSFFLEAMDVIQGDPSGHTIQSDGSIRESGVHNWVATWMGTLLQDTVCCLLLGPSYLTRLELEGARNPDSRDTITIPRNRHASPPPGVFREMWVRDILVDLFFVEPTQLDTGYLEIMDNAFDGQIPASAFIEALREARVLLTKTPLKSLGGGKLLQVTELPLDRSQWAEAERWLVKGPPRELRKNLWRSWFAGSVLAAKPTQQKQWWHSLLPGKAQGSERQAIPLSSASQLWAQGIKDRALFLPPRGKRQGRKALNASL